MRLFVGSEDLESEILIPPSQPDGSKIGVNYTDAYIKALNTTTEEGLKITCKRRGLKIILTIGDRKGEGLMRRLEYGPDVKNILQRALQEAAQSAGAALLIEKNTIYLELEQASD